MHDISRWLFLAVLVWPAAAAVWLRSPRSDRSARTLVLAFAGLVIAWAATAWRDTEPAAWGWSAGLVGGVPIVWRFGVTAIGLFWTVALALTASVTWSGLSNVSRRIGPPGPAGWLLVGSVTWLAAAANPFTQLVCWALSGLAMWLFLRGSSSSEALQHTGSRMLVTGLLMDGMLIGGSVATEVVIGPLSGQGFAAQWNSVLLLQGVGWLIAGVGRAGLPPALGWSQGLVGVDRNLSVPFWWLGVVPSAGIAFARAGRVLPINPELFQSLWLLVLVVVGLAATTAAARSGASRLGSIPTLVAGLMAIVSLWFPGRELGVALYLFGYVLAISLPELAFQTQPRPGAGLMRLAARDWGIPHVWRVFVELPLRGAAQLLRFLDGLVFEQVGGRIFGRLSERVARVGRGERGDPVWLPAVALLTTVVVLMLTRRW